MYVNAIYLCKQHRSLTCSCFYSINDIKVILGFYKKHKNMSFFYPTESNPSYENPALEGKFMFSWSAGEYTTLQTDKS